MLKRYSTAFFEAARRQKAGVRAGFPRRKRGLVPVRFRKGSFAIDGSRIRLGVARGAPELWVRLGRAVPYPVESVRSVTLVAKAGRLFLDVTAEVPVAGCHPDPARVAGIDLGIIHPYAVMAGDEGLLVSGRQIRAEERLHLDDTKRRACRIVHIICGKFATPLRAESSPARTAGIGATATSSVPETSPPEAADPRVQPYA